MIQVSDGMAIKWGASRQACDEYALRSQEASGRGYASA